MSARLLTIISILVCLHQLMFQPGNQLNTSRGVWSFLVTDFLIEFSDLRWLKLDEHGVVVGLHVVSIVHAREDFGLLLCE